MAEPEKKQDESNVRKGSSSPLVFISHDSRDAELAEVFSKLLSSVSAGVLKSFRSSDRKGSQGIEYGVEWYPELMRNLGSASDVVCLLTQQSLDRPWILYEAGVAKGKLDTPVYGVALGIALSKANSGPFAQFQNCDDNEDSLTKLVLQLLSRVPGSDPDRDAVRMQVAAFKNKVDGLSKIKVNAAQSDSNDADPETSSIAKLFEEIKVMFQDLPSRVESRLDGPAPVKRRRSRRLNPMMFEEITHRMTDPGDPMGLLVFAGFLREDFPWLYEIILEIYREVKAGNKGAARRALGVFEDVARISVSGPWIEEFGMHGREDIFLMDFPFVVARYLERIEAGAKIRKKPTSGEG